MPNKTRDDAARLNREEVARQVRAAEITRCRTRLQVLEQELEKTKNRLAALLIGQAVERRS